MRSGTRLVLVFLAGALVALVAFLLYGSRAGGGPEEGPLAAARSRVLADNTVVGLVGGFRALDPLRMEPVRREGGREERALGLVARVVGARDTAFLYADLVREEGRWRVSRAAVVLSDGRRLPLEGRSRPSLEPPP